MITGNVCLSVRLRIRLSSIHFARIQLNKNIGRSKKTFYLLLSRILSARCLNLTYWGFSVAHMLVFEALRFDSWGALSTMKFLKRSLGGWYDYNKLNGPKGHGLALYSEQVVVEWIR